MTYDLYAHVCVPRFSTDETGAPDSLFPMPKYRRVFVANYKDRKKLMKGVGKDPVFLDQAQTLLVPTLGVHLYEIVDVP